eukprot:TRINITY_DN714_c0_g1_i1.p1 TRINITY_DN714_c0_g1~~TRINITY_DN714_c0_g1_i1.p1  ORF type:complete len:234 (+),score=67.88 TRINITY_DN714_c0_g1_i1:245-946(+)
MSKYPTPLYDHLSYEDFIDVYEPAQDTFLLLDALEKDDEFIKELEPVVCLEIGSGSGCVITFLALMLKELQVYHTQCFAVDINPKAALATKKTAIENNVNVQAINCNLLDGVEPLFGKVDILLFNPPYVCTEETEYDKSIEGNEGNIIASWAGGINGTNALELLIPNLPNLLSDKGCFYLLLERKNNPKKILKKIVPLGFSYEIILERKAFNEFLQIAKFCKVVPEVEEKEEE